MKVFEGNKRALSTHLQDQREERGFAGSGGPQKPGV